MPRCGNYSLLIATISISYCDAFSASMMMDRRDAIAGIIGSSISIATGTASSSPDASSTLTVATTDSTSKAELSFSGYYTDPEMPDRNYRIVRPTGPGELSVTVKDEPDGQPLILQGKYNYNKNTGETTIDRVAVYNGNGVIELPNGGQWVKDMGIQGIYKDRRYPDGYRSIRQIDNAKLAIEITNRANEKNPYEIMGIINKKKQTVTMDFSYFSGPKKYVAEIQDNQLVFPDTEWTKL